MYLIIIILILVLIVLVIVNLFVNLKKSNDALKIEKHFNDMALKLTSELYNIDSKNNEKILNLKLALEESLSKNSDKSSEIIRKLTVELTEKFGFLSKNNTKDLNEFKDNFKNSLTKKIEELILVIEKRLDSINSKVEEKLNEGFKKSNETFTSILQRLTKIDEAQKKIDGLSNDIVSLQDVLTDKKSRGIFGEIQLNQVLYSVFGEKNDKIFKIQHMLSTNDIVDAIIFAPAPVGNISIDSKFPLENYKKMYDKALNESEKKIAQREFKRNVKHHIDVISKKYILTNETANQAIMFLPAEAIFAEINAYHQDLIEYSQNKKVWICSPTTLMAVLTTLQIVVRNAERQKYAHIIQIELNKLGDDFKRYKTRWDSLAKHMETVNKDVKEIHVTTDKIGKKFENISKVEIKKEIEISD